MTAKVPPSFIEKNQNFRRFYIKNTQRKNSMNRIQYIYYKTFSTRSSKWMSTRTFLFVAAFLESPGRWRVWTQLDRVGFSFLPDRIARAPPLHMRCRPARNRGKSLSCGAPLTSAVAPTLLRDHPSFRSMIVYNDYEAIRQHRVIRIIQCFKFNRYS